MGHREAQISLNCWWGEERLTRKVQRGLRDIDLHNWDTQLKFTSVKLLFQMKLEALVRRRMDPVTVQAGRMAVPPTKQIHNLLETEVGTARLTLS